MTMSWERRISSIDRPDEKIGLRYALLGGNPRM